jgi:protein O-GlcNAc transferase
MNNDETARELFLKGLDCLDGNDFAKAETFFARTLELAGGRISALNNLAVAQYRQGKLDEAALTAREILKLDERNLAGHLMLSNCQMDQQDYQAALITCEIAISIDPTAAEPYCKSGSILNAVGRYRESVASCDRAIELQPQFAAAFLYRGNSLQSLNCLPEALAAYDKALSIKPDLAHAWLGRANVFFLLERLNEATVAYNEALALNPDLAEAWFGRANVFLALRRFDEAFVAYDKAFSLKSDLTSVEGNRLHSKMHMCDWHNFDEECRNLIDSVRSNKGNTNPFAFIGISDAPEDQLKCAKLWTAKNYPTSMSGWQGKRYDHDRIRLAYLSADFGEHHPVSYLMAGVFEWHNRKRFETTAISFGPDDGSETRARLLAAFDRFVDVRDQSDEDIARLLRTLQIDIAVDLMGYTKGARTAILADRPAPLQVNYLGYPGTMGADFIDYLISDPTLIPSTHRNNYLEKIAYLPNSYMPNDDLKRTISDRIFDRTEFGLPETGCVFCCFNNIYKFNPDVFYRWARILKAVEGSVLWLSATNPRTVTNLRKEIGARGVDPNRLVFADRLASSADHLARHRLADLFLDTLPYNAHTTASDALWAGLPVLTQIGETFAGRVAASLLNALGLTELITHSWDEYETTAIKLAADTAKLASIKDMLERNRLSSPLFNTRAFTHDIEAIYAAMHARFRAGLPPDHIQIR